MDLGCRHQTATVIAAPHPPPYFPFPMLRDIQTYIASHGTVSIQDLALKFHTDSDALQPMLQRLNRKGRIRQLPIPEKCDGCTCCDLTSLECYEWVDR